MNRLQLFDSSNISALQWPNTEEGKQIRDFFLPILQEGSKTFVSNVRTSLYLLKVDDIILPISVNEKEYENSYVVSNYYVVPFIKEWFKDKNIILKKVTNPFLWIFEQCLKRIKINKVIFVNNWLFMTNAYPTLLEAQIDEITQFLANRFPDHAIIFRNINRLEKVLYNSLKQRKFHVMPTRPIYIYDPKIKDRLSSKVHYHHRSDSRLFDKLGYNIVKHFTVNDVSKILELYEQVYIKKHTSYSPLYTEKFLKEVLEKGLITFTGIEKDGELKGIFGTIVRNNILITPFFGYETQSGHSQEIYRMLTYLIIREAEDKKLVLNDSSGSGKPKTYRGMSPMMEYTAIYDRHLPMIRKLFWKTMSNVLKRFVAIKN